jgi:hypothetical protein
MLVFFWTKREMGRHEWPQAPAFETANAAGPLQEIAAALK